MSTVRSRWTSRLYKAFQDLKRKRLALRSRQTTANLDAVKRAKVAVEFARRVLRRHRPERPTIYSHRAAGISPPTRSFGALGAIRAVTIHHAAGPRATSVVRAIQLNRSYDQQHRAKDNWGGLGYHETVDDEGNLYVSFRATELLQGAHVGEHNSNNYGILLHGNYETDQPTAKALATLKWRIAHGHEAGLTDLRGVPVLGHRDWPGHRSNACPGRNLYPLVRGLRAAR